MNAICRSCDHHETWGGKKYHIVFGDPFHCLVCEKETKALYHEDDDFFGMAVECDECHNYILYITPEKVVWKDEIYIKDLCLIRNNEDNITSLIGANDREISSVDGIIQFKSISDLKKRIKTMMVFS